MILVGLGGLLVGSLFCAAAASALRRAAWPQAAPDSAALLSLLLFAAVQSILVATAGLLGFLSPGPLAGLSAIGLVALGASGRLPRLPSIAWKKPSSPWDWALWIGSAVLAISFLWKALVLAPYWGDALTYHLPNVAEWIRARRIVWGFSPEMRTWFPMGYELIEAWWCVFLGRDSLIEFAGIQMLLIAVAAVRVLARSHGFSPGPAAFIFATTPLIVLHVTACGNDLAAGAMILAGYALIADGAPAALQVFPLLMGAGMKPTAIFGATGVLLFALRPLPRARLSWKLGAPLVASAFALGALWYLRNWIVKGHPLYPVYGGDHAAQLQANLLENLDTLRRTLVEFPDRAVDRHPFSALSPDNTSWGWFVLPWGLPLTLMALRRDEGLRRLAVCFVAGAFVTIAMSPLNALNLRFALWFPALFALGAARAPSRPTLAFAALAAALNFIPTVVPPEAILAEPHRLPASFPRTEPLACVFSDDIPSYLYYNSDFSRPLTYPRTMEELRASGVRYVAVWGLPEWAAPITRWKTVTKRIYEVPP